MGEKEYRSAVRSRELIHEAMLDLICKKNLNDITVKEVATRARINRGTFYAHYCNLGELLEEIEKELLIQMSAPLNGSEETTVSPEMVARHIIRLFESYPQFRMAQTNNSSFTEIIHRVFEQYLDSCLQKAPASQREDPALRPRLQLIMMFVFYGIINCDYGVWSVNLSYSQTVDELINICRNL